MTTYADFRKFFNAVVVEVRRHDAEKGDSWKNDEVVLKDGRTVKMDKFLDTEIIRAVHRYTISLDPSELIDITALCGFRWMRATGNVLE